MRFVYLLTLAISFSTLELSAQCYDQKTIISGNLKIFDRWVRQMPKSYNSTAGYLKIQNMGETEVELLRVETNFSGGTEFHLMQEQYGIMKMIPVKKAINIPANSTKEMNPGGLHIMFTDIEIQLELTKNYQITLHFEAEGAIVTDMCVKDISASSFWSKD